MTRINIKPKKVNSNDGGLKPWLESAKTAFPNIMQRVTQTVRDRFNKERHSERIKPYLADPGASYPFIDETWPDPLGIEFPPFPAGGWTDVNYGPGEDAYRFQCQISCSYVPSADEQCTAPIKCSYGAWTVVADGNVKGWRFFDSDGSEITDSLNIEWKPSKGLSGEIWATPKNGRWDATLIETPTPQPHIKAIFVDKGDARDVARYHPLLQRWIKVLAGKSICDYSPIIIRCEACQCPSGNFAFDDSSTPDTIAPGGSISVYVSGGCPPYSWSVSGTGYTLDNASTTGLINGLNSAAGTCGVNYGPVATVTITDNCSDSVQAIIRNTGGTWTLQETGAGVNTCTDTGGVSCTGTGTGTQIIGKYRYLYTQPATKAGDCDACKNPSKWPATFGMSAINEPPQGPLASWLLYEANINPGGACCVAGGAPFYREPQRIEARTYLWTC
jgi:hypothetical protein